MLAEWRSVSMECGEECHFVVIDSHEMIIISELCANNWGTVSTTHKEVS